jgi:hypothetical protein
VGRGRRRSEPGRTLAQRPIRTAPMLVASRRVREAEPGHGREEGRPLSSITRLLTRPPATRTVFTAHLPARGTARVTALRVLLSDPFCCLARSDLRSRAGRASTSTLRYSAFRWWGCLSSASWNLQQERRVNGGTRGAGTKPLSGTLAREGEKERRARVSAVAPAPERAIALHPRHSGCRRAGAGHIPATDG